MKPTQISGIDESVRLSEKPLVDSGLASSSDASSTGAELNGKPTKALFGKRPVRVKKLNTSHDLNNCPSSNFS